MGREQTEQTIHDRFMEIVIRAGYNQDGSYNISQKPEVSQLLGRLFFDYFVGAVYDVEWEGLTDDELVGVGALLTDMNEAYKAGLV